MHRQTIEASHDALLPRARALRDWAERAVGAHSLPGLVVAQDLAEDGWAVAAGGHADRERGFPMTTAHRMHSGSQSKSFVAALALLYAAEGLFDLDASIAGHLGSAPWFGELAHAGNLWDTHVLGRGTFHAYLPKLRGHDRILAESGCFRLPPAFAPGAGVAYSELGLCVAALALEAASGEAIEEEIQRRLLYPLNLMLTAPADSRVVPGLAKGYTDPATRARPVPAFQHGDLAPDGVLRVNFSYPWAAGWYVSNPKDLARWSRRFYGGDAFDADYLPDLLGPTTPGDERIRLGAFLDASPLGPRLSHAGGMPGYGTVAAYYPERGFALAVQANMRLPRGDASLMAGLETFVQEMVP